MRQVGREYRTSPEANTRFQNSVLRADFIFFKKRSKLLVLMVVKLFLKVLGKPCWKISSLLEVPKRFPVLNSLAPLARPRNVMQYSQKEWFIQTCFLCRMPAGAASQSRMLHF